MENNYVTRMSLGGARMLTLEQLKENLNKNLKSFKEAKPDKEGLKFYVYVTSNVVKSRGCKFYSLEDIDKACKQFKNRAELKSKRLFVAVGVDYHEGAQDLVITGTDY